MIVEPVCNRQIDVNMDATEAYKGRNTTHLPNSHDAGQGKVPPDEPIDPCFVDVPARTRNSQPCTSHSMRRERSSLEDEVETQKHARSQDWEPVRILQRDALAKIIIVFVVVCLAGHLAAALPEEASGPPRRLEIRTSIVRSLLTDCWKQPART